MADNWDILDLVSFKKFRVIGIFRLDIQVIGLLL